MKELQVSSRKIAQVIAHKMVHKCLEASYYKNNIDPIDFLSVDAEIKSYSDIMGALTCKDDLLLLGKFGNKINDSLCSYINCKLSRKEFESHLSDASDSLHKAIFEIEGK